MNNEKRYLTKNQLKVLVKDYLDTEYKNNDYNILTISSVSYLQNSTDEYKVYVVSESNPEDNFYVFLNKEGDNIRDNKILDSIEKGFQNEISLIASKYWNDSIIDTSISLSQDMPSYKWSEPIDFVEFLNKELNTIPTISIIIPNFENAQNEANNIYDFLKNVKALNITPEVSIYFNLNSFDEINISTLSLDFDLSQEIPSVEKILESIEELNK